MTSVRSGSPSGSTVRVRSNTPTARATSVRNVARPAASNAVRNSSGSSSGDAPSARAAFEMVDDDLGGPALFTPPDRAAIQAAAARCFATRAARGARHTRRRERARARTRTRPRLPSRSGRRVGPTPGERGLRAPDRGSPDPRPPSVATAPDQNVRPMTDASRSTGLRSGGRASIRRGQQRVHGRRDRGLVDARPARHPPSRSMAASCSAYRGEPAARSSTLPRSCGVAPGRDAGTISDSREREARQRQHGRTASAGEPVWVSLLDLRPGRPTSNRQAGVPRGEVHQEPNERLVRPVEVFDDQTTGAPRDPFDKPRHAAKVSSSWGELADTRPHERAEPVLHPRTETRSWPRARRRRAWRTSRLVVRLEDPGVGGDDLGGAQNPMPSP